MRVRTYRSDRCIFTSLVSLCTAGIEWDDSTRGKNDGSATGADGVVVRYFTTKTGATTSASFLKPELLFTGVTIQNALHDR